jgi:hypothetical protein
MPPKKKVTLTDAQKHEFCMYARDNKQTRAQYVNWIEHKWGVRVNESTITRILQTKDKRLATDVVNPKAKRHKSVTVPELELAIKEFVLNYQHKTIITDALLIEKAKQLASGFGVSDDTLKFSLGWLEKFKKRNKIRYEKLQGEAASADQTAIVTALPVLLEKCTNYPLEQIYNMDETGLFYRYEFFTLYLNTIFLHWVLCTFLDWNQINPWQHNVLLDARKTKSAFLLLCVQMLTDHTN